MGFGAFGQQTQQPQTNAFGAPATGFGQPSAFGAGQPSTNAFGAPSTGFGGGTAFGAPQGTTMFGQPAATASSSGFGGFGAASAAPSTGFGSALGAGGFGAKPATSGFGGFGAAPTPATGFGGAGGFGAAAAPSAFGAGTASGGAFGAGAFGGTGANATNDAVNNGTGNPRYQPSSEDEQPIGAMSSAIRPTKILIHHVNAMMAYRNWSPEELRFQDYTMGKKHSGAGGGATGAFGTGFGAAPSNTGFGAAPATGFGAAANSGFGASAGFGAGSTNTGFSGAPGFGGGGFGSTPATTAQGAGMFGAPSGFGGQSQPQQQSAFGFGQPASTQAAPTMFGQAATTNAFGQSTVAPAFGQQQAKPAFGFGAATTQSPFGGQTSAFGQAPAPSGGIFGANPASSGMGFGATPALGQPPAGGFGFPAASSAATGAFGSKPAFGFGAPATTSASLFGAPAASSGLGLFNAASAAPAPSLFGAPSQPRPANSLFTGASQAPGFALGNQPFGQTTKPAFSFGAQSLAASAPGGLFGAPATGGGLFGTSQPAQGGFNTSSFSTNLFNTAGGVTTAPQGFNSSLNFGQSMQQQQQQNLNASIDKNPYGLSSVIFAPAKKQEAALLPTPKAKQNLPVSPYIKVTARESSKVKLRGFSPPRLTKASPQINGAARYESAIGKSRDEAGVGLDARFTPRKNVRRLVIEEPIDGEDLNASTLRNRTPRKGVTFDLVAERDALNEPPVDVYDDDDYENASSFRGSPSTVDDESLSESATLAGMLFRRSVSPTAPGTPTPRSRENTKRASQSPARSPAAPAAVPDRDEYILSPPLEHLLRMETEELRAVKNFKISVPGIGSIRWVDPVDLIEACPTKSRSSLDQIAGNIVTLVPKCATVYPNDADKPPVGMGLNVRAEVELEKCWPIDKGTREFILDTTDPRHDRHMKKLEAMPDTEFLGYHNETGTWKFNVDHFSRYGLDDDDDEDEPVSDVRGAKLARASGSSRKALSIDQTEDANPFFERAQVGSERGQTDLGAQSFDEPDVNVEPIQLRRGYGLVDNDDDEDDDEGDLDTSSEMNNSILGQKATPSPSPKRVLRGVGSRNWVDLAQDWQEEDSESDDFCDDLEMVPEDAPLRSEKQSLTIAHSPLNAEQLEVAHNVQRLKSSLFAASPTHSQTPVKSRPQKAVKFSLPSSRHSPPPTSPSPFVPETPKRSAVKRHQNESSFAVDREQEESSASAWHRSGFGVSRGADENDLSQTNSSGSGVNPALRSPKKYYKTVAKTLQPFSESIAYGQEKVFLDPGLLMGRSSRVGWGPGGVFVVAGGSFAGVRSFSNVSLTKIDVFGAGDEDLLDIERSRHEKMLGAALDHTKIVKTVSSEVSGWECDLAGESSEGTPKVTNVPVATLMSQLNFEAFVDVIIRADDVGRARAGDAHIDIFSNVENLTWRLAAALWDPLTVTNSQSSGYLQQPVEQALRREAISRWLKAAVNKQVAEEAKFKLGAQKIFTLLTGRQIGKAVLAAVADKNLHLATVLAQLGGAGCRVAIAPRSGLGSAGLAKSTGGHGITTRHGSDGVFAAALSRQVDVWDREEQRSPGSSGLSQSYLMLWKLAAGTVGLWGPEIFKEVRDWKRTFGLFMWYGAAGGGTVSESLSEYHQAFANLDGIAPPIPAYLTDGKKVHDMDVPHKDICFHLLKLYTDRSHLLETALHPLNVSANDLDYRLPWMLWMVLSTVKGVRSAADAQLEVIRLRQSRGDVTGESDEEDVPTEVKSAATADRLARDLIWQLETLGLWKWGVFVALFLSRKEGRERAVREILGKHYPLDDDSGSWITTPTARAGDELAEEDNVEAMDVDDVPVVYPLVTNEPGAGVSELWGFLVEELKVPELWIHEARALKAKYEGDVVQEAVSLIDAKQWVAAHRVIVDQIAPEDIINENYSELKILLRQIRPSDIEARSWVHGGKLLLKYLEIVERVPFVIRQARDYQAGYSLSCSTTFGRSMLGKGREVDDGMANGPIGNGAGSARAHACKQLRAVWVGKIQSVLRDLASDHKHNASAQRAKTGPAAGTAKAAAFVSRTEMAGRLVVLLLDCRKVLAGSRGSADDDEDDSAIDGALLAELPLVPARRSAALHRLAREADSLTAF
ncbi:Nuclear pore complex protein Nup98-Nup96 [Geranomyces variabilis]|uniref:Nuclear pore complex protein Nup98-Nup96 n=1 Tax=Geranomyces variabilis TaxID=109894 RepID=A0AAD5TM57_9FUNG|nr:Nuclear pore complex protein Nup98-Nup96 [Geranomyces variabilis]